MSQRPLRRMASRHRSQIEPEELRPGRVSLCHDCPCERTLGKLRVMPTVLRSGPYRFFFYSGDRDEPPHVHIERDENRAKFWLQPIRLQSSGGFARSEINRLRALVVENEAILLEAWNEFFGH